MKRISVQRPWFNVMELLVTEEAERQLRKLPPKRQATLSRDAVATFALNRLNPLYANSSKGYEMQEQRARQEFSSSIELAVRQGIAAVERDPLKTKQPLEIIQDDPKAEQALRAMGQILQRSDLNWDNLPGIVESALGDAGQGRSTWRPQITRRMGDRPRLPNTGRLHSSR